MDTDTVKALAFSAVPAALLGFLYTPTTCPNVLVSASEQTGCKNALGWTMFGTVGFVGEAEIVIGALLLGAALFGAAVWYENRQKRAAAAAEWSAFTQPESTSVAESDRQIDSGLSEKISAVLKDQDRAGGDDTKNSGRQ